MKISQQNETPGTAESFNRDSILISMVASAKATKAKDLKVADLLNAIKSGKWRNQVIHIRTEYSRALSEGRDAKAAVRSLKEKLPGAMWSGRFASRKKPVPEKLLTYSGFLCADLDDLGGQITEIRAKLITSPHLFAVFSSPTGSGLKAIFRVTTDGQQHTANYHAVAEHVKSLTGVEIDAACKDVSRLCYVSYDPDLWINPQMPSETPGVGGAQSSIRLNAASCMTASLHSCVAASLHNNTNIVLVNIKAKREALEKLAAQHRNLVKIYEIIVEPRFQGEAHARNRIGVVQAVPFLYRVVAPQFVLPLVGCFYDCNRGLFNDTREQHMREATDMLEAVAVTYANSLSADDRQIYDALPEQERNSFRICRDLALAAKPPRDPLTFFMSFNQLGDRLGIFPMQAQRIMRQLENYPLITLLKKGTRRAAGVRGEAGEYQWLLQPQPERSIP